MSGPVDVLAVWNAEIDAFRNTASLVRASIPGREAAYAQHMEQLERARDVVAELIEASNEMLRVSCTQGITDDEYWPAVQKFDAALARLQGEQA